MSKIEGDLPPQESRSKQIEKEREREMINEKVQGVMKALVRGSARPEIDITTFVSESIKSPKDFFDASRIGKLCKELRIAFVAIKPKPGYNLAGWVHYSGDGARWYPDGRKPKDSSWPSNQAPDLFSESDLEWSDPIVVVFAGAADVCVEMALHGECPGVNPSELQKWLVSESAKL